VNFSLLPHGLAQQRVRHRVVLPLDFDVIIEADLAFLPFRLDVGLNRQRLERGAFDLIEQRPPASSEVPRHASVELRNEITNGGVDLGKREEALMAQLGDDSGVATCTATSTLALSRGFLGRAGTMAVP
jgi:hypothetical protein